MRIRKLQRRNQKGEWFDDAYVYENDAGQVIFRYNLAWDRIGSYYNGQIKKNSATLEDIDMLISSNENLRWMPIEVIDQENVDTHLAKLDEACAISHPRPETKKVPA